MGIIKEKRAIESEKETHATDLFTFFFSFLLLLLLLLLVVAVIFRSLAPLIRIRPLHDRSLIIVKGFVYYHPDENNLTRHTHNRPQIQLKRRLFSCLCARSPSLHRIVFYRYEKKKEKCKKNSNSRRRRELNLKNRKNRKKNVKLDLHFFYWALTCKFIRKNSL